MNPAAARPRPNCSLIGNVPPSQRLCAWLREHGGWVGENLTRHGALLLRGFDIGTAQHFENVARAIDADLKNNYPVRRQAVGIVAQLQRSRGPLQSLSQSFKCWAEGSNLTLLCRKTNVSCSPGSFRWGDSLRSRKD